jgi:hypothetical protein
MDKYASHLELSKNFYEMSDEKIWPSQIKNSFLYFKRNAYELWIFSIEFKHGIWAHERINKLVFVVETLWIYSEMGINFF